MNNTVMIVDDKKANIDMLVNILQPNYTIMAAVGGETAFRIMEKRQPDLVLMDVYMPGLNGLDVLALMQQKPELASIPVVFVTGEPDEGMEEKGLALGAVDYIRKPFNAAIVRYKVRNHLQFKAHRDHLELMVRDRTKQLATSREAIIMGMSLLSESHDKVTGDHIERIKRLTQFLCEEIRRKNPDRIPAQVMDSIILYSPLHDVGKVGIRDGILKKESVLTPQEFEAMKTHTVNGAEILRKTEQFFRDERERECMEVAIEIAECHHEKYDGSGYPYGLAGEAIPVAARIVALADVYDALRSPRPYKNPFSHQEATRIILSGDGRTQPLHFDPMVLDAFVRIKEEFDKIYHH